VRKLNEPQIKHDELVDRVYHRLLAQGENNLERFVQGINGEYDLVKYTDKTKQYIDTIYEIKYHNRGRLRHHAIEQLERAWLYQHTRIYGVYISQDDNEKLVAEIIYKPLHKQLTRRG
jgi:hypothetical protein